eukprot:4498189-Pyramimonas_sp.AAC.1
MNLLRDPTESSTDLLRALWMSEEIMWISSGDPQDFPRNSMNARRNPMGSCMIIFITERI